MPITKLDQMIEHLKSRPAKRVVAAFANDSHTIGALAGAMDAGIVEATLVGDKDVIARVCQEEGIDAGRFTVVHEPNEMAAVYKAVELINQGAGQIIMKGLCSTDRYMKGLLDKEKGLMDPGAILSHVSVIENPHYHKLIICGDVAVLPAPELKEKIAIVNYMIAVARALGIETPKVAIIAATEQMSFKMQACVDAAIISKMAERGQIKGALVDGPQAVDVAVDRESAETKGVKNPVAGDADCLLFPDIEAGNVFYKTNTKLAGCELAAMVVGARCPAILSSRGDSTKTKLYSIALAALTAK
ncbi:MAG: phosphate acyltransferase [Thermoanaerobaculaceae bacterium]